MGVELGNAGRAGVVGKCDSAALSVSSCRHDMVVDSWSEVFSGGVEDGIGSGIG